MADLDRAARDGVADLVLIEVEDVAVFVAPEVGRVGVRGLVAEVAHVHAQREGAGAVALDIVKIPCVGGLEVAAAGAGDGLQIECQRGQQGAFQRRVGVVGEREAALHDVVRDAALLFDGDVLRLDAQFGRHGRDGDVARHDGHVVDVGGEFPGEVCLAGVGIVVRDEGDAHDVDARDELDVAEHDVLPIEPQVGVGFAALFAAAGEDHVVGNGCLYAVDFDRHDLVELAVAHPDRDPVAVLFQVLGGEAEDDLGGAGLVCAEQEGQGVARLHVADIAAARRVGGIVEFLAGAGIDDPVLRFDEDARRRGDGLFEHDVADLDLDGRLALRDRRLVHGHGGVFGGDVLARAVLVGDGDDHSRRIEHFAGKVFRFCCVRLDGGLDHVVGDGDALAHRLGHFVFGVRDGDVAVGRFQLSGQIVRPILRGQRLFRLVVILGGDDHARGVEFLARDVLRLGRRGRDLDGRELRARAAGGQGYQARQDHRDGQKRRYCSFA